MNLKSVGSFEAKTHFAQILTEVVDNDEKIVITRHGKPLAVLSPYYHVKEDKTPTQLAISAINSLREGICLNLPNQEKLSIRDLINEGRY